MALGVLTAVCVSFLLRSTALALDLAEAGPDGQSIMQRYGPGLAMLTLLPALIAAVPFALPARARGVAGAVGAVVLTVLTFVWGEIGLYYFPLMIGASGFVSVRPETRDRVERRPPAAARRTTSSSGG
ncbi:hypothetical protein [Microtetraspora malaysiensis]|uniref:hypothetical protein n=1 Tax=Microtetraspora malaysiensis TaxID=161358 RepID=UPI0012F7A5B0|nr:hypothetical protein [Microtetraspora malaysiensis]